MSAMVQPKRSLLKTGCRREIGGSADPGGIERGRRQAESGVGHATVTRMGNREQRAATTRLGLEGLGRTRNYILISRSNILKLDLELRNRTNRNLGSA
jgi:hypothetical protein